MVLFIFIIPSVSKASFVGASSPVTATTSCNTGLSCGLVGYWTFDGKDISNGVVLDKSGNGKTGNIINIASSTFFAPGKIGQSFKFDGIDDRIDLSSSTILNNSNWTVSVWVKVSANITQHILTNQSSGPVVNALGIYSNKMLYYHYNGSWTIDTGNAIVADNKWHLLTWVNYSNQTMDMYVDGILDATGISSSVLSGNVGAVNRIGSDYGTTPISKFLKGFIDDLRIYHRSLSLKEIQQLYSMGANTKIGATAVASSTNACTTGISCGLVGYWTFDGKDVVNGVILDKSGMGNNGNPVSIASSTFYAPGKIGQGANFNGYVLVPDNSSLKPSGPMSWGGWINQYTTKSNQTALSKVTIGTSGYMLYTSTTFPAQCFAYGLTPANLSDPTTFTKNTWVHYMCVYDGSQLKIYKNGVLVNFTSVTGSITHTTNGLSLGSYAVTSTRFEGKADDLRVYNRALSDKEVQQLYSMGANTKIGATAVASSTTACTTGLSCGLVGYWTFDGRDISNGVLLDKSGNNNRGNMINIASTTFYTPGKLGQAGNFDGVDDYANISDSNILTFGNSTVDTPLAISLWVKPDVSSGAILSKASSATAGEYYMVLSSGGVYLRLVDNSTSGYIGRTIPVSTNKWQHIVGVYNGSGSSSGISLYNNGVLISSTDSSGGSYVAMENLTNTLKFGERDVGSNHFDGSIDDVRIYNRALSAQEIQQLYNLGR